MILVKPTYEIIPQVDDILGAYEQSEIGARICYKSENVIKYDENGRSLTAKQFVDKLMNVNKHGSVAEHGTIYLRLNEQCGEGLDKVNKYVHNKYSHVTKIDGIYYITTNLRVINENGWWDDLNQENIQCGFIIGKTKFHEPRITIKFNTQIVISREANRHRVNSISEQSTRYCNYSKDKFNNEVRINVPEFVNGDNKLLEYEKDNNRNEWLKYYCHLVANDNSNTFSVIDYWLFGNLAAEFAYHGMIKNGAKPEQARTILPLDTHTEVVYTAFLSDWIKFINLRATSNAHPDIRVIAKQMRNEFISNEWVTKDSFVYD